MTTAPERLRAAFERHYGHAPTVLVQAPGRVNLIGEHTDYNDGLALPITLDRATYVALRPRTDAVIRFYALNYDEASESRVGAPPPASPGWMRYAGGAAHLLHQERGLPGGFDAAILGEVPIGAGLSSSAALEIAVLFGLKTLFDLDLSPMQAARFGQRVEHTYAGVQCGIMDQCAIALGRRGHALFLDCRSLAYDHVPLQTGSAGILVVDSRAPRDLAASAYNARRAACEEGVSVLRAAGAEVGALRDVSPELLDAHADRMSETVYRRCRHVVDEIARVEAAVAVLRAGDPSALGTLMNASHESLRTRYEVSSPNLDLLVDTAQASGGVLGARLTGAGFGGCIVALVERDAMDDVSRRLVETYERAFGFAPEPYPVVASRETAALPL